MQHRVLRPHKLHVLFIFTDHPIADNTECSFTCITAARNVGRNAGRSTTFGYTSTKLACMRGNAARWYPYNVACLSTLLHACSILHQSLPSCDIVLRPCNQPSVMPQNPRGR